MATITNLLKARRDTIDEAFEVLTPDEFDIAEKYVDLYIDFLETYEQDRIPERIQSLNGADVSNYGEKEQ